jgi:hypothetical protein
MNTNSEYKINKVAISGNGINELYLDVEWEGNENIDFYELRVLDRNKEYVESCAYVAHNHRMVIKDYLLGLKHKELRSETFYVELGIPEYNNEGKELSWKVLASYEPIFVNIYYEQHIFRKNVLEIREPKKDSPRRKSEEHREAYLNTCRVIVAGSRGFFDYNLMSRELDKLFNESKEFAGNDVKIISGMADGADSLAIRYADERKLTKILFPANWKRFSRVAGFLRNEDMLSVATHLVVFWDGKSSGTHHMIEIAKAKRIPIWGQKYPDVSYRENACLERWY